MNTEGRGLQESFGIGPVTSCLNSIWGEKGGNFKSPKQCLKVSFSRYNHRQTLNSWRVCWWEEWGGREATAIYTGGLTKGVLPVAMGSCETRLPEPSLVSSHEILTATLQGWYLSSPFYG